MRRLEALQRGDAAGAAAAIESLQREALLDNPLLRFDKLLLVRRRSDALGMMPNWGGKTDIAKTGYDNEIVVLSPVRPDGALRTVYRPAGGAYVGDLDLHWNADRLLLSMPGGNGGQGSQGGAWNVYELRLDPATGLPSGPPRQVTPDLPEVDSYDGAYLPDGRILFSSTAAHSVDEGWVVEEEAGTGDAPEGEGEEKKRRRRPATTRPTRTARRCRWAPGPRRRSPNRAAVPGDGRPS